MSEGRLLKKDRYQLSGEYRYLGIKCIESKYMIKTFRVQLKTFLRHDSFPLGKYLLI